MQKHCLKNSTSIWTWTHPVDKKGLGELDDLQRDQKTDGDEVVEQDDEGEEVKAKVSCPTIYKGKSFRQKKKKRSNTQKTHQCWFIIIC